MTPTDLGPAGRLQSFCHLPIPDVSFHGEFGRATGPAFGVAALPKIAKNYEPALVSAVDGAGSAMLFSVAAAI
jgi:hypothetical protein